MSLESIPPFPRLSANSADDGLDPIPAADKPLPLPVVVQSPRRVLLVDDEPEVLRSLARMLRSPHYEVTVATSGRHAIDVIRCSKFDVIVSDIGMSDIDGLELLRRVRQSDPLVPFVLLTGTPARDTAARALELGAFQYLVKPVDARILKRVVEHASRVQRPTRTKSVAPGT
jgi:DNA-binding NtrC family response regulator